MTWPARDGYLGWTSVTGSPQPVPQSNSERTSRVEWHGTLRERLDLIAAVQHNCECSYAATDGSHIVCSVHVMFANDQRALDGLLWNRHLVDRLRSEEGVAAPGTSRQANA
jgi:hypothetical protein